MDLHLTEEQVAFRQEVRDFLDKELPSDWIGGPISFANVDQGTEMKWRKMLAEKGWNTIGWPKEYGGQGASPMTQLIFNEEWEYRGAPGLDSFGLNLLGPTLMVHGTEEQKRAYLGDIARGEVVWCQGFSEPGSGSDLASLQTRAVEDGDEYVINGQKIWSSYAQYADHMFLLARTDTSAVKHRGISFLLLDMDTPGITVRPIQEMSGESSFNEEFFDNVRIPKQNVLGEVNRGWYVAMTLLDFERTGINHPAGGKRILDLLIQYANETSHNGKPLAADPRVRTQARRRGRVPGDFPDDGLSHRLDAGRGHGAQHGGLVTQADKHPDVSEAGPRRHGSDGAKGAAGEGLQVRRAPGIHLATSTCSRCPTPLSRAHRRSNAT